VGTTNSKPPGPIIMIANQDVEHQSDHIHYALVKQVHIFTALFTSLSKLSQHAGENSFS